MPIGKEDGKILPSNGEILITALVVTYFVIIKTKKSYFKIIYLTIKIIKLVSRINTYIQLRFRRSEWSRIYKNSINQLFYFIFAIF